MMEALWYQLTYHPDEPMIFCTSLFVFLFALFTLVYALLRYQRKARLLFVTAFSYYFYYKSSGFYFFLLAIVTLSDFFLAEKISNDLEEHPNDNRRRKCYLALSLIVDLGMLAYFKYTNFFAGMLAQMVGHNFQPWDIFLPVGISFFTFQSLSYTIDVYRGQLKPLNSFLDYAFFVSFFPQLVAGPIVRARDFVPQIREVQRVSPKMRAYGVYFILVGAIKKCVVSDYISINFVDRVFEDPTLYSGLEILMSIYGYALQIYCDFSGYSDMAIGIALLLGFIFDNNFNAPFKSSSISQFWHRWHISFSSWIRDYLYIFTLGGNRKGKVRTYVNLFVTMLLAGLWHGAAFNYVVWGGMHGIALALHRFFRMDVLHRDRHYQSEGWRLWGAVFLTFHFVCFTFLFFRNSDFQVTWLMLDRLFTDFHPQVLMQFLYGYGWVVFVMALGFIGHFMPKRWLQHVVDFLGEGGLVAQWLALVVVVWIIIQVKSSEIMPFIYFQF